MRPHSLIIIALSSLLILAGRVSAQPYSADFGNETDPVDIFVIFGSFDDDGLTTDDSGGVFVPVLGVVVMPDTGGGGRIWMDQGSTGSQFLFAPGSWMQQSVFFANAAMVQSSVFVSDEQDLFWTRRIRRVDR